jgi:hypothetical protein
VQRVPRRRLDDVGVPASGHRLADDPAPPRRVPGQHVGLQTDDAEELYRSLGFERQPEFWSRVVGTWLDNDANR